MAQSPIDLSTIAAGTGGFVIHGQDLGDQSGFSVASAGDINGDGFDDLLIGARYGDGPGDTRHDAGDSYVVFGQAGGFGATIDLAVIAAGTGGFVILGADAEDRSGASVASAGDINGDGFADLIIGARFADATGNTQSSAGDSYVLFGKASGFGATVDLTTIADGTGGFVLYGEDSADVSGWSVASAGDVNADGFDDLIIGAPSGDGAGNAETDVGDTYVLFGKAGGFGSSIELSAVAAGTGGFVIHGEDDYDRSGYSVASAGDVDGDGIDDLLIGTNVADGPSNTRLNGGGGYVVFGRTGGFGASIELSAIAAGSGGFVIHGQGDGDLAGRSVAAAGDVNGDGFGDLIIGAQDGAGPGNTRSGAGESYVVFGKGSGFGTSVDLLDVAAGTGGFVIYGVDPSDQSGHSVTSAGDVNGDGVDDLLIGAVLGGAAGNAKIFAGDTYVVFGKTSGFGASIDLVEVAAGTGGFVIYGQDAVDQSGGSVAAAGDVDGDGFDDLLIGAAGADGAGNAENYAGDSYVVFGRDFTGTVTHAGDDTAETLTGTAGADDMVGGRGDDTLVTNGGADVAIGGSGNDTIKVTDLTFARVDGGSGTDTLALDGAGIGLSLSSIADSRLQNIEVIDLTGSGNNGLVLSAREVLNLSSTINTLKIDGDAGDTISFGAESWTRVSASGGYVTYANGQAVVQVSTAITFTVRSINLADIAAGTGGFVLYGQDAGDRAGASVASAGDINGDGYDDLIIGAFSADGASNAVSSAGDIYVVFGKADGFDPAIDLTAIAAGTGGFVLLGRDANDQSGFSVASAGDINADGFDDIVISADQGDAAGNAKSNAGESYVLFGKAGGFGATIDLSTIASGTGGFVLYGQDLGDRASTSVASAGDVNGDGFDDIILGAPQADGAGNTRGEAGDTYVVFGKAGGFGATIDLSTIAAGTGGFVIFGAEATDQSGRSVASAGDINGDGLDDLIIGVRFGDAVGNAKYSAGDTYVVFGRTGGFGATIDLVTIAAGTGGFVIYGQDANDQSGLSVAAAGDINGDGFADLIIGAPLGDVAGNAKNYAGESYVLFGKASGFASSIELSTIAAGTGGFVILGQDALDRAGYSVASAGDINGDGFDDIIIGAVFAGAAGNATSSAGESYVVFGTAAGFGATIELSTIAAGTGGFVIFGQDFDDRSGFSVASAGDVDGDGFDDIIVGSRLGDAAGNARTDAGESYVIFGRDFTRTVTHAGTTVSETLTGTAGADDIVAGRGDDILEGLGGADALIGGAGNDTIKVADLTFLRIDGGSGTDTFALDGAGITLTLSSIANSRLQDIEVVDLTGSGNNGLILSALEVLNLSSTSNTLKVDGNAGDAISFGAESWTRVSASGGYVTYANGQAVVQVSTAITFTVGSINLADIAAGTGGFVLYGQDAGDLSGASVASAGDINGDGFDDIVIGARYGDGAGDATNNGGDTYVVFGKAGGFDPAIDLSTIAAGTGGFALLGRDTNDQSGYSVASAGDVNGDGFDDIVIGARYGDGAGDATSNGGDIYVVFGKTDGFGATVDLSTIAAGTGGFVLYGVDPDDRAGISVASAGDINGDGFDDLLIGAPRADAAGNATADAGDTYVVFGKAGGFGASVELSSIAAGTGGFVVHGLDANDSAGFSVASAGDFNADGFDDLIIGGLFGDAAGNAKSDAGDSYVVFGKADGFGAALDLTAIAAGTGGFVIHGEDAADRSGNTVASAGDLNGDGFDDLVIGAPLADAAGNAKSGAGDSYVVFGKASGFDPAIDLTTIASGTGGFVIHGQDVADRAGQSVASAGDVNGDGFDDIIIGAPLARGPGNALTAVGDSYVVFGKAGGFGAEIDLATIASGTGGFVIYGQDPVDQAGFVVASAGDVDGDGFDDILVGVRLGDAAGNAKSLAGETYVIFGRDFTRTVTHAGTTASETLAGSAGADDIVAGRGDDIVEGLGGADALIGGAGNDTIKVADLTFLRVDGGSGTDTLALDGAGITLTLSSIANSRLQDIEVIDLTGSGDNGLTVSALEVLNLSSTTNTLRVDGDAGDAISFGTESWTRVSASGGYVTYANGQALVQVSTAITITVGPISMADVAGGTGGFVLYGQDAGDRAGRSVASAGDINGDGYDDLLIGAIFGDGAGNATSNAGDVYVVFGKAGGLGATIDLGTFADGTGGFVLLGRDANDQSGRSVASAGDINGDGFDDIIIGAYIADAAGNAKSNAGESYVVFGKAGGFGATVALSTIAAGTGGFVLYGQDINDRSGLSVASAGDVNGDGFDDIIIGAREGDAPNNAKFGAGESYVVFGKASGFDAAIDLSTIAAGTGGFVLVGQDAMDYAGQSAASAGDINGDGLDDLIIGALSADAAGNAKASAGDSYVVFGKTGGFAAAVDLATIAAGTGGFVIHGQDADDNSGLPVISAGDINGDGFDDLVIGARFADGAGNARSSAGDIYVVFGKADSFDAEIDLVAIASGTGGFVIHGQDANDNAGYSVASAGDVNGDGFDDIIIGAEFADGAGNAKADAGESYVVFGKAGGFGAAIELSTIAGGTGGFILFGQDASDRVGTSVASAGDVDGDGFDDILVGARLGDGAGNAKSDAGESYVLFGRDFILSVTHAGTAAAETLTGTVGADSIVAGRGDDILEGLGGTDALAGGAGNDTMKVTDLTFLRVDGGSGTDTLALEGAGINLSLATIANPRLQDIEVIDLTGSGDNTLTLSALEVLNLSSTSNRLRVDGNAGDTADLGLEAWAWGGISGGYRTYTLGQAIVEVDTDVTIACFAAGTLIRADTGDVPVQDLRVGDRIITASGQVRPVRWIGLRRLDLRRHPRPEDACPILIRADALGDGVPARDLLVSPEHAMFIDGGLIPARLLVNGGSIVQRMAARYVEYFHVELDSHDILLAEGAPAESYLDTGNRGMFENAAEPTQLHPRFADGQAGRVGRGCAPLFDQPADAEPIWRTLATRSLALGHGLAEEPVLTDDPGLVVAVGARMLAPIIRGAEHCVFMLPAGTEGVRLVSWTAVPGRISPWHHDRRRLGVSVRRITLRRGDAREDIPLDHPALASSWWAMERDGQGPWRWTDGSAALPVSHGGAAVLEITFGTMAGYEVIEEREAPPLRRRA